MRRSSVRVRTLAREARKGRKGRPLWRSPHEPDKRCLPPVAERRIHKGESSDRGGIGPHHPRAQGNGENEGFCKEGCSLLALEPAFGPDQNRNGALVTSAKGLNGG